MSFNIFGKGTITGNVKEVKARDIHSKVYGVIIPPRSGKTTLVNDLNKNYESIPQDSKPPKQVIWLDIDETRLPENVDPHRSTEVYPVYKRRVFENLTNYPENKIVIFTNSPDLLEYIGVKKSHISVYVPLSFLWQKTNVSLIAAAFSDKKEENDKSEEELSNVCRSRDNVIRRYNEKINYYSGFDELAKRVSDFFEVRLQE